jgi:hypothetical protein
MDPMPLSLVITLLGTLGGVVGVWVKLSNDVARLKSRVIQLELDNDGHKKVQSDLLDSIHKIEITLAQRVARLDR